MQFLSKKKLSPEQQRMMEKMQRVLGVEDFKRFQRIVEDEFAKPPKVAVIGKAGVGKSTTINAIFNLNEKVSHISTGTLEASENIVNLPDGGRLSVIDLPGLGEDIALDEKYKKNLSRCFT